MHNVDAHICKYTSSSANMSDDLIHNIDKQFRGNNLESLSASVKLNVMTFTDIAIRHKMATAALHDIAHPIIASPEKVPSAKAQSGKQDSSARYITIPMRRRPCNSTRYSPARYRAPRCWMLRCCGLLRVGTRWSQVCGSAGTRWVVSTMRRVAELCWLVQDGSSGPGFVWNFFLAVLRGAVWHWVVRDGESCSGWCWVVRLGAQLYSVVRRYAGMCKVKPLAVAW